MRHVAVIGMSFCGSTILSYVLGSLRGCATIGESHWLVDAHPSGKRLHCNRCGDRCEVLTDAFREGLAADRAGWYARIAAALGTDTLISSDKSLRHLERLAPERDYDALILFKRPDRHAQSHVRVMQRNGSDADIPGYFERWCDFHTKAIDGLDIRGEKLFLWIDDFLANPQSTLRRLAGWLNAPYDESALQYWVEAQHAIGGNFNPWHWLKRYPADLPIRPPGDEPPVDAAIAAALSSSAAWSVFDRLVSRATPASA